MMPIVAIIPSLNPDETLVKLVSDLIDIGFTDIILVDDGSSEESKHIFKEISDKCILLEHTSNLGKGAGLKTAFKYYVENFDISNYKGVVTLDADGQHLPADVLSCSNRLIGDKAELILGTRNFNESSVPFKSKYGNKLTTIIFWAFFHKKILDTQTGLRVISNSFLTKCLAIPGDRFEYEINVLIDAVKDNIIIKEEFIETVYINSNRETHFNPLKDSLIIYREMFKAVWRKK